jgi:hypothetical protein
MRFVIFVRTVPAFEAETQPDPDPALLAEMAAYHEALSKAGVLIDGSGLQPSRTGWRVHYNAEGQRVEHGPFAAVNELVSGWTLIQVKGREEALEWTRRFPNPVGPGQEAVIEVRQLYELEDFTPGPEIERMKNIELGQSRLASK